MVCVRGWRFKVSGNLDLRGEVQMRGEERVCRRGGGVRVIDKDGGAGGIELLSGADIYIANISLYVTVYRYMTA